MTRPPLTRPLGEALLAVAAWPRDAELYLPVDADWALHSPCIVVEDDRYTGVDPRITHAGIEYAYALQREQVRAVVDNCRARLGREPTDEEACQAFLYYFDNERYIGSGDAP